MMPRALRPSLPSAMHRLHMRRASVLATPAFARPILAVLALAALFPVALFAPAAMAQDTDGPSVTVEVTPREIVRQGAVTISGLGYAQPGAPITVTVEPPGGSAIALTATPASSGRYTLSFVRTASPGEYTVSAQLGANGKPAKTTFKVRSFLQNLRAIDADQKTLADAIVALTDSTGHAIDNMPESPALSDARTRLTALHAKMQALPQQSTFITKALALFADLQARYPEATPLVQPMYDKLDAWDEQARIRANQLKIEIGDSRKDLGRCDSINDIIEDLNMVSGAISFAAQPFDIAINFSKDFLASKGAGSLTDNPGAQTALIETTKILPAVVSTLEGPLGIITAIAGVEVDIANQIEQAAFSQYCQKFEGPFNAVMIAHFYTNDTHAEWWAFSVSIAGKLTLRYPKEAAGNAVALSGEFVGRATHFGYREYVWSNSGVAKLAQGGVAKTIDIAPVATPNVDWEGRSWSSVSSPTSFDIPVTGQLANGRITFKLGDARSDFDPTFTQAHTVYVVMNPYTLGLPVWGHFTLPYKDAHFVLQHYIFDYPVVQTGKSMVIEKNDVQDRSGPGNTAHYTLQLKACNPGCD